VLVTGGSGFVGLPLLRLLAATGEDVHAVSHSSDPPAVAGVAWHRLDLGDGRAVQELLARLEPERMIHTAWYVEHGRFWAARENLDWVGRSLQLLRAFAESGGRRVVMTGTCAEYDWSAPGGPLDERVAAIAPATLYGAAKDALRRLATAYCELQGVELAWGRIFFMYGPREAPGRLVASLIRGLLAGETVDTTSGSQQRDFLHVEDVARATMQLLDSETLGPVNIASGEAVALAELIDAIAAEVGGQGRVRRGALPDRPGEPPLLLADVRRLREEVGFRPQIGLRDGIADTVAWWRAGDGGGWTVSGPAGACA
jgi:nucleoside-diphosphate-sugar epimerase